jgi:subtilisin family serine protease
MALSLLIAGGVRAAENASVPGQLIVRFRDGVPAPTIDSVNQSMGANASRVTPADSQLYLISLPQGMDNASGVNLYNSLATVAYAEENFLYESVGIPNGEVPNDPYWSQLWGLRKISAPEAWVITTGDPSIIIADTDSGADYNHVDFAPNVWVNQGEICDNGIDDDNNGYVDDCIGWNFYDHNNDPMDLLLPPGGGHGSNTAGIMGAVGNNGIGVTGVMWNAQIMLLRMGNGSFPSDAIVKAIDYAWQNGAWVINASWGSQSYSTPIYQAIQRANSAGVLFVAAAGNNGTNNDVLPFYPANFDIPNIISVANTTSLDQLRTGTEPSNWGPNTVHLAAPGTGIVSTYPGNRYVAYVGTSQAAPHVAATAALVWSINSTLSVPDVKNIILTSVDPVDELADKVITGGRLNASAALNAALLMTPAPP